MEAIHSVKFQLQNTSQNFWRVSPQGFNVNFTLGTAMPEEKPSQSLNISGGQLSDVQIGGMAGRDLNITQNQLWNWSRGHVE